MVLESGPAWTKSCGAGTFHVTYSLHIIDGIAGHWDGFTSKYTLPGHRFWFFNGVQGWNPWLGAPPTHTLYPQVDGLTQYIYRKSVDIYIERGPNMS
jgi:hypothetical protein